MRKFRRPSKRERFPEIDRSEDARKDLEMGRLNHAPRRVSRWPLDLAPLDSVIYWTWRDQQKEFFGAINRERWTKRAITAGGLCVLIGVIACMVR